MCSSWNTPDRIFTASGSWRWVTNFDWPGRRFSIQGWISASVSAMPGGQPSTTQPIAGPWLSPKLVTRNRWPKVLCDIGQGIPQFALRFQFHDFAAVNPENHALRLVQGAHLPPVQPRQ